MPKGNNAGCKSAEDNVRGLRWTATFDTEGGALSRTRPYRFAPSRHTLGAISMRWVKSLVR